MYSAVIVETRRVNNIKDIIDRHFKYLDKNWELFVFHGPENEDLFEGIVTKQNMVRLGKNIDIFDYNYILASESFWTHIPHEKILIFQHDSGLLKHGIEEYLQWDYIGAPWYPPRYPLLEGGNGGLALRSKSVMLKVVRNRHYVCGWMKSEDFYFSKHVPEFGRIAPRDVCDKFSCEMRVVFGTLGYHGLEKYLKPFQCEVIKTQYTKRNSIVQHFDEQYYLNRYPDVRAAIQAKQYSSGLSHFLEHGLFEDRWANSRGNRLSSSFNEKFYLEKYPDVAAVVKAGQYKSGFNHYIRYGIHENRFVDQGITAYELWD